MRHEGSCHCGGIAFTVEADIKEVLDCNCSLCRRRGGLLAFVGETDFALKTPKSGYATYTFNQHKLRHHFCPTCGIAPFSEGKGPDGKAMVAINVRCLPDVDLGGLTIKPFDGASM